MKTVFTQFRYLLIAALMCLVSGSVWGEETYELVTSDSKLVNDGTYIIVGLKGTDAYALSLQNKSNRASVLITISDNKIVLNPATASTDETAFEIVLKGTSGAWGIYDSVNQNYLRPKTGKNNGLIGHETPEPFNITIGSDGVASIVCNSASYDRNTLMFNQGNTSTSPLFACYASGQQPVYLYKKVEVTSTVASPTFTPEPGTYWGKQSITLAQSEGAAVYYTLDGSDPKAGTLYSAPFEISATTTVKAVAKSGDEYSNVVSAEYVIKSLTAELPYEISFKEGLGDWIITTDNDKVNWTSNSSYGAVANGYVGSAQAAEVWLISPEVTSANNIVLSFESATKFAGNGLKLYYAANYNLETGIADWTEITDKAVWPAENSGFVWTESGNVAVASVQPIRFAFKYTSTADAAATWEITNLSIKEGAAQDQVETPTFTPEGGASEAEAVKVEYGTKVTVACATPEATIYGGDLEPITEPIAITQSSQKIEAYATKTDMTNSEVATAWYSAYVANPTFSISEGRVAKGVSLTITSTTADAVVTYTINDGAEQTYSAPVVLDEVKEYIIKAKATIGGMASEEVTATYTVFEPVVTNAVLVVKFVKDGVTAWYAMDQVEKDNGQGSGYNMNRKVVEVAEEERQVKATEDLVWTIEADNNQVYLKAQNGKYLGYRNNNRTEIALADEPYAWTVTKNSETNTYTYDNIEGDRRLAYNDAYSAFRCYLISNMDKNYTGEFYLMEAVSKLPSSIDTNNAVKGIQAYSFDGTLVINAGEAQNIRIYSLDGRMVRDLQLSEGENTVNGLAKGVYLMNNQKVVVK